MIKFDWTSSIRFDLFDWIFKIFIDLIARFGWLDLIDLIVSIDLIIFDWFDLINYIDWFDWLIIFDLIDYDLTCEHGLEDSNRNTTDCFYKK